jgi:hypothetical protein
MFGNGMMGGMNPYQGMGAAGQVPPPWASMPGGGMLSNAMGGAGIPGMVGGAAQPSPWQNAMAGKAGQGPPPMPPQALAMLAQMQAYNANPAAMQNMSGPMAQAFQQAGQSGPGMAPWAAAQPQRAAAMQAMMGMPPGAQGMAGFGGLAGMLGGNPLAGSMPRGRATAPAPARQPRRGFTYAGANYNPGTISLSGY